MRRYVLLGISLLATVFLARAEKVSPQQAAAVAERFLAAESGPATKASHGAIHLTGTWPQVQTKGAADEPALYIFERDGGGYVVVAGDDASLPVIGYSTTGALPLDRVPANLRFMLDWHASMIDYARKEGLQADAATKEQWLSSAGNDTTAVVLETAHWNQNPAPYNDLIPQVDGKTCPAGCLATAIAIIMRYHRWPERGTGTLPDYYWEYGHRQIDGHELGHTYDWSQMPLVYEKGEYTSEQGAQVARLLYDVAVMCQMNFSPAGSGASSGMVIKLSEYFGYDKQIRMEDWDYYTKDVWEDMIREEIDADRPVLYCAYNESESGHAFVVDGYKGAFFSLNYGWGFGSDFYLLRPTVPLDEDAVTKFCKWARMITHIYPDRGGEPYINFVDDCLVAFPWDFRSKSFPVGDRNLGIMDSSGEGELWLGFVLYDREGRFKQLTSDTALVSSEDPYVPGMTCNITCSIEDGDRLMISKQMDGHWEPITQSSNAYLTFHPGQKISELVSIAYSRGNPEPGAYEPEHFFSLCGTKDIYWEIWSEDLGVQLATCKSSIEYVTFDDHNYLMSCYWIRETDEYRAVFYYPPGHYRLLLRNFDEEMTLMITL